MEEEKSVHFEVNKKFLEDINVTVNDLNVEKGILENQLRKLIAHFAFDWSRHCLLSRSIAYDYFLDSLNDSYTNHFSPLNIAKTDIGVLISDVGIGRLKMEISKMGFLVYYHLSSELFVNSYYHFKEKFKNNQKALQEDCFKIYPYSEGHGFPSQENIDVTLPDSEGSSLLSNNEIISPDCDMLCGDFITLFHNKDTGGLFRCIITGRMLNYINNVTVYIQTIYHMLDHSGIWIHQGLFEEIDIDNENCLSLTFKEVSDIAHAVGFNVFNKEIVSRVTLFPITDKFVNIPKIVFYK